MVLNRITRMPHSQQLGAYKLGIESFWVLLQTMQAMVCLPPGLRSLWSKLTFNVNENGNKNAKRINASGIKAWPAVSAVMPGNDGSGTNNA